MNYSKKQLMSREAPVNSIMNPDDPRLDKIYHYTNVEACASILRENRLWATDYRFVNDRLELRHALEGFIEECPEDKRQFLKVAMNFYANIYFHCVASFSKYEKVLSQWRAYADDGRGVAIGFSKYCFDRAGISLYECKYEESHLKFLVSKYSKFTQLIHDKYVGLGAMNSFLKWVQQEAGQFKLLIHDLLIIKNPAFNEEDEIRAIATVSSEKLLFRSRDGVIIPYTEFVPWGSEEDIEHVRFMATPEIVLGPRCDLRNEVSLGALARGVSFSHYDCGYTN